MNMSVNNNRATTVATQSIQPTKAEMRDEVLNLTANIKKVGNSIEQLTISIERGGKSLNRLNSIADKHGDDSSVRLKGSNFKPGEGDNFIKNMFNGGRYQEERQAAATKLGARGSEVSASDAISLVKKEISTNHTTLEKKESELNDNMNKKKELTRQIQTPVVTTQKTTSTTIVKTSNDVASKKTRQEFSLIYQSDAGCKALNTEARYQSGQSKTPGSLSGSKVIAEYQRSKGDDIFSGGNKDIKNTINACSTNLSSLVKAGAKAWYTPGGETIKTHRGQGMTQAGFNALTNGQTYKLGQFFSTSKSANVAKEFANDSKDAVKVMFEVEGNSSRGIFVGNGLSFGNSVTEEEKIYSPLANFKVTRIVPAGANGINKVVLKEVKPSDNASLLPY